MADKLLQVNGISVRVEDKEILHDINLEIGKGETHVLMGTKRCGKINTWLCTDGQSEI